VSLRNRMIHLPGSPVSLPQLMLAFAVLAALWRAQTRGGYSTFFNDGSWSNVAYSSGDRYSTIGGQAAIEGQLQRFDHALGFFPGDSTDNYARLS